MAIISAKTYLNHGSPNILLLGSAVLVSGLTALFAGWASSSANANVTVFNVGILVSSGMQLLSAIITLKGVEVNRFYNRKITLAFFYIASVVFVTALTMSSVLGLIPPFFTSTGPTLLCETILATAAVFFALAFIIFGWQYLQSKSKVLYWYSLALAIIAIGLFGALFIEQFSGVLAWLTRFAQYAGGFYFILTLLTLRGLKESDANLSGKWHEAFRNNREQIAALFSKMLNAFTYCEILTDKDGKPVDWVYLDANDAFEKMAGHKKQDIIGRKATDLFPGMRKEQADWIGRFGHVAITGEAATFENFSQPLKRWYNVSAYSPKKGYFIVLSDDITERKKAEQELKQNEQRWATTLSSIGDAVIATDIEGKITFMNTAAEKLTGYNFNEASQKPLKEVFQVINELTRKEIDNPVEKVLEKGNVVGLANQSILIRKDGSEVPIDDSGAPIKSDEGKIKGVVLVFRDITERKNAERQRRQADEKHSTILKTSQSGYWLFNREGKLLEVNEAYSRMSGYSQSELIQMYIKDLEANESEEDILNHIRLVQEQGHHQFETRHHRKDGTIFDVDIKVNSLDVKAGQFIVFAWDITEHKKMEETLRETKDYFDKLLNYANAPIIVWNKDFTITLFNHAFERLTGLSQNQVIGKHLDLLFPKDRKEEALSHIKRALEGEYWESVEIPIRHKDGTVRIALWNSANLFDQTRKTIIATIAQGQDITERKKIEEDLASSEMKYRRLYETTQDGIIARNLQGRLIDCNQAYANMLGYSKQELKDHSYTQVLPEKWCEHREAVIKEVLETGKPAMYEREYIRKDSSIFPASVRTWRLTDDKGEVMGVWSTVRDITEQKDFQKKLEQYSKQLEQLVEERTQKLKDAERLAAIGETAGMVGHDIRNPLQSIIADVYLSKEELKDMPESEAKTNLKESLNSIENQTIYINKIVADLQDYTKLTKPHLEETDLQPIIQDTLSNIPIPENIKQTTKLTKNFPKITVDRHLLKRILTNIILNAVQAMPKGGELTIIATAKNQKVIMNIKDTGEGIPEEVKKNLFKPLFTTKPKGQGFGLPVAKKLTDSLNGTITFESEKDKGTTFTITLPNKKIDT